MDDAIFRAGLFDGQVLLITGGGTGIGRCIAREAAGLGATVFLVGRREEPLRTTADDIRAAGGRADWTTVDIRAADAVDAAVTTLLERHERLDALVNNAGGQFPAPAEAITPNGWRAVVDLNLTGTFLVSRAAYRAWMAEHGGAIVSIVADMWNGFPFMAHTGAARAGVVNLTKTLAVEWARSSVRVNAVAPGVIDSSGLDRYDAAFREAALDGARRTPAGRLGTESETSAAVLFLLSPAAAFITGETIKVDGGASLVPRPFSTAPSTPTPPFDALPRPRSDGGQSETSRP